MKRCARILSLTWLLFSVPIQVALAETPFKFVIFGDTQNYTRASQAGAPDLFTIQTKWVKNNAVSENIVFLTHVGDVILNSSSLWPQASQAMNEIDGVVPYGVTFGNHDGGSPGAFGSSRYQGKAWYLGASSNDLAHAQKFTAEGTTYIHINLPHSPKATELTWAQGIIDAHPDKPTIITTHGYMADNGVGRDANGNTIWNTLIEPNEEVFMVFCGHDWVSRHEIATTTSGRKVLQVMVNYQEIINGGQGWFQWAEFDPDQGEIRFKTYSPFLDLYRTDVSSQFTISATFGTGTIVLNGETGYSKASWNGGGGDANWQTIANWEGQAPVAGEVLEFKGTTQKVSVNDFPAGTSFGGIVFPPGKFSAGYQFSGNAITLTGDIVNMGGYGPDIPQTGPTVNLPITLVGERQVNTGDWDMTINGVLSGSGSLTKTHGRDYIHGAYDGGVHLGDLYLTALNTYTGATRVTGGALLLVDASKSNLIPDSSGIHIYHNAVLHVKGLKDETLKLAAGQTLRGSGKVMGNTHVPSGASIAPGHAAPGTLFQLGDVTMESGSALNIRFGGSEVGDYDQLNVAGALTLGGATLNLSSHAAYTVSVGDTYMLIENDEVDAVTQQVVSGLGSHLAAGTTLPEGAIVSNDFLGSGLSAQISYVGGSGNDLVLKILPAPGPPEFTANPLVRADAVVEVPYHGTLAESALDGDGDPIVYSKVAGPEWLNVNPGGSISGTPTASDMGVNEFTVKARDSHGNSGTATLKVSVVPSKLVGVWEFENREALGTATVGSDLLLTGSIAAIGGPGGADGGAAAVGVGEFLTVLNPIGGNGTGNRTNEYTLLLDIKIPSLSPWIALFDTSGGGDADYFYSSSRGLGVSSEGYVDDHDPPNSILADTWHRMVISVDQGGRRSTYVDGVLVGNHNVGIVDADRWSLASSFTLFSDNGGGEEAVIHVSGVRLFNQALNADEVAGLGDINAADTDGDCMIDTIDTDDDNDGMEDSWENAHSLNRLADDRELDADGDGFSNWQEYVAATDPQSISSIPYVEVLPGLEVSEFRLQFPTSSSRYYAIEHSETMLADSWNLVSRIFLGSGAKELIPFSVPSARGFYRVVIFLP
ncbi:metallophosphoesterase [Verrucomicrobiaceae bacterium N1E253]|uniref:Metallophosphoesterase n=2 Tax=Oceaniferula marina TaxID=2748318 RepID=A0A851GMB7_9BACT|nr:LamG-like jellyroll fold domain-containing protein [Oceaniferula marina]NWK56981.1 metallophosphoesterase [Oceaniferula marina]